MNDKEQLARARRVLTGLTAELAEAKRLLRGPAPMEAMERKARGIAEYGGMLHDVSQGRGPERRDSSTTKVRRAMGYTYP